MRLVIDRWLEKKLKYNPVLVNKSHEATQELSYLTENGIARALMDTSLAPRFHKAKVTKFLNAEDLPLSSPVEDMVMISYIKKYILN